MAHFPMFIDVKDKTVLICGGGREACDKVRRIMPFGAIVRVISPDISAEMEGLGALIQRRSFEEGDLECHPAFVIAAEGREENHRIAEICRAKNIPVNAVDQPSECDFIFPSMITSGDMTVAVSTGGRSPSAAAALRERIETVIPGGIEEILPWMEQVRAELADRGYDPKRRRELLRVIVRQAFLKERPLSGEEVADIIEV